MTLLREEGLHANDIMSVTGHKSSQSLRHYSTTTSAQRRAMSYALSEKTGYKVTNPTKTIAKPPVSAAVGAPPRLISLLKRIPT